MLGASKYFRFSMPDKIWSSLISVNSIEYGRIQKDTIIVEILEIHKILFENFDCMKLLYPLMCIN